MTKHDLKEMRNLGAELGAAKADNEKLRGLLHEVIACQAAHYGDGTGLHLAMITLADRLKGALSQQADPAETTETYTAVEMATAAAQAFRDGQAAVEPAAAQDERECETGGTVSELLAAIMHFGSEKWAEGRGAADPELANVRAAWDSVYSLVQDLATRPEQTEQQPVGWIHEDELPDGYPYDAMFPFSKVDVVRMFPVYAPIAQTAPQGKFRMGDLVKKSTGSEWQGRICGTYSTALTPEGYAVESEAHAGSVQIYPAKALEAVE